MPAESVRAFAPPWRAGRCNRILHVIPSVGPLRGGPSQVVRLLARGAVDCGLEVHVAATDDNRGERLRVPLGVAIPEDGVNWWYFRAQTPFYLVSLPFTKWLRAHIEDYDVVHIHALFSYCSVAAAFIARSRRIPYIVRPLGVLNRWGVQNRRPWLKRLSFQLIEKRVIANAAAMHYTSDQELLEAAEFGVLQRSIVIPNPALPPEFERQELLGEFRSRHPELAGRRILLFLSRIDAKKGLDILIDAYAGLRARMPQTALVIAGSGDAALTEKIKARARQRGVDRDIVWTGFLEGREKWAALADADLFVLPSYSENFGVAAIEAMMFGVPVVVSDQVAIHKEVARAGAGIVARCDVREMQDAMAAVLAHPDAVRSFGARGVRMVSDTFSLEKVTRKLIEAYTEARFRTAVSNRLSEPKSPVTGGAGSKMSHATKQTAILPLPVKACKRILHIIPSAGPLRGGPSQVVHLLARGTADYGLEVHVAATDDNRGERLRVPLGVAIPEEGVTWWYFRAQTPFYLISLPFTKWLRAHIEDYDLVHIHALFSYCSVAAAFIARSSGVPYIVQPHGVLNRWGVQNRRPWLKRLSFQLIEKRVIANAAAIHYTSDQELLEAAEFGVSQRSIVIPNPALPPQFERQELAGEFRSRHPELAGRRIVLFLSRIDAKKGLDILIDAYAGLRARMPEAAMVIAGSGDAALTEKIKTRARQRGVDRDIVWTGFLEGREKWAALADADLFVLPSYSENFGVAAIEAMMFGLPVVVSDQVAIHKEIARAGAGIVTRCDAREIEDAMAAVLAHPDAVRSFGTPGFRMVSDTFSLEKVTRTLIDAYHHEQ